MLSGYTLDVLCDPLLDLPNLHHTLLLSPHPPPTPVHVGMGRYGAVTATIYIFSDVQLQPPSHIIKHAPQKDRR